MNLAKSSVKVAIATGGSAAITFGGIALFARLLSASELGVFFLFEALLGMLFIPADFGIRGALQKRISEGNRPGQMLTTAVLLKIVPLTIVVAAVLLARPWINRYVGTEIAVLLAVAIVCYEAFQLTIDILSGELRVGDTASVRVAPKAIWLVSGVAFVEAGYGVHGLIYATILGYVLSFVWGFYRRSTPFRRPTFSEAHSLTSYSRYNFISAISGYFYSWMDVALIGLFLTTAHVSAYESAWRVSAVAVIGSTAIAKTIFPQMSRWDAKQAINQIEGLIPRAVGPSMMLVIPAFFGVALFARDILYFVFGSEYAIAWVALIILMAEKILQSVHSITGRSLKAIDHPELAAKAALFAIAVNLALNVPLIQLYGIVGAAVATALSFVVNTVLCMKYLSRFLTIELPWRDLAWIGASSMGMSAVLVGLRSVVSVDSLLHLLAMILVGVLTYGAFVLASPPLRREVFQVVQMLQSNQSPGDVAKGDD
ncbi:Membrane protein involved in the export of O-antigen and teichoic acid [Halogeometricum rufum]|uniref:Membrane protein involved in the export of O-antigen and teichoic acid n=1 Tax=Halogeometricum rufum TaxID=553469 RepID=A0A1I6J478_9EURY|nr:flippase [Halogeometricum rufum]SFR73822.1 Membrane protein involved in the export of O-antigen and teichoic acid [Halogeometricum rufum]